MDARRHDITRKFTLRREFRGLRASFASAVVVSALGSATLVAGAAGATAAELPSVPAVSGVASTSAAFTGRIVVGLRPSPTSGRTPAALATRARVLAATLGGTATAKPALGTASVITPRNGDDVAATAAALAARPDVTYAEAERVVTASGWTSAPTDPLYSSMWDLAATTSGINTAGAWRTTTGAGVTVAVVDTGIAAHAELSGRVLPGSNFAGQDCSGAASTTDENGHGSHIAGTIAAAGNNGQGIVGIAPDASLLPVKVLNCRGSGSTTAVAQGIAWAAGGGGTSNLPVNPSPAKVISLSLGGIHPCTYLEQAAIDFARAKGSVVVVAAGNDSQNAASTSPANCRGVITVGSTGRTGARSWFSNYGSLVALSAPGESITSLKGASGYVAMSGTSMATPHVSAVAALLFAIRPTLTPDQVRTYLTSTARAFPVACSTCGDGILDARAAVAAVQATIAPALTSMSATAGPLAGGTQVRFSGKNLGATSVTFGGVAATVVSRTDSALTVTTPARGAAGTVPVVISSRAGSTGTIGTSSLAYTYLARPSVTKLSSVSGSRTGGQTVVLTGAAYQNVLKVTVGGVSAPFKAATTSALSLVMPKASGAGKVTVVVSTPGGSSTVSAASTYTYR